MVNALLAHFGQEPKLEVRLRDDIAVRFHLPGFNPELLKFYSEREPDWDGLREYYDAMARSQGKERAIYINPGTELEWREAVLGLSKVEAALIIYARALRFDEDSKLRLSGYKLDSFTVQAQRKDVFTDYSIIQAVVFGFTIAGNELLLGGRGGSERAGEFVSVPAGAVPFPTGYSSWDSIKRAVYSESSEEAGITPEETKYQLVGIFGQEPPAPIKSKNFVYVGKVSASVQEILGRHEQAIAIYQELGGGQGDIEKEIKARKALEERAADDPRFPMDAWENAQLSTINNEPGAIMARLDSIQQSGKKIVHGLHGALALYFLHQFGEKEYERLMSRDSFRELVDASDLLSI